MNYFSKATNFFGKTNPEELIKQYGSPLYVYNETIFRERCKDMANILPGMDFKANYSIKANSNLSLLKIVKDEGLSADAMSPGEIFILLKAGFKPEDIFYVSNNVSKEEFSYAIENNILTSVDSVSQLEMYGKLNPGGRVAVRFNAGIGAGHHEKVITAGKKTKFGVNPEYIGEVKETLKKYNLKLSGINQHIGSLFMDGHVYVEGVKAFLDIANNFEDLEFVDMGGGFGINYKKQEGENSLNIEALKGELLEVVLQWQNQYGKKIQFKSEPGRYISAESGILLGTVHALKTNYDTKYVGTDLGFNVLSRPVMYDSHHEIELYKKGELVEEGDKQNYTVVGNICESGDIIAKNRKLFKVEEGDVIGIMDAGAYGYSMSSNYNNRLRPAEVLIKTDGEAILIRRRDNMEDLIRNFT